MNRLHIILLSFLLMGFMGTAVLAQGEAQSMQKYASQKIKDIYLLLPKNAFASSDSTAYMTDITHQCPIYVIRKNNLVQHIGIAIVDQNTLPALGLMFGRFVERILLEIVLRKDDAMANKRMGEYQLKCSFTRVPQSRPLLAIESFLKRVRSPYSFYQSKNETNMLLTWIFKDGTTFKMSFPLVRELVEGTDKKEADDVVFRAMTSLPHFAAGPNSVDVSKCTPVSGYPFYMLPGTVYAINRLRSDTYYTIKNDVATAVFTPLYIPESIKNLFLGVLSTNHTLRINHRSYGADINRADVRLSDFISYWQHQKGFACYCGVDLTDSQDIQVVLLIVNEQLQYIHMLKSRLTKDAIFNEKGVVESNFFTNIPQHNVNSLFGKLK